VNPRYALLLAALPASLAAASDDRPPPKPAAKPVGAPVNCIPLNQIRETRVRDDWTIDFVASGNRVWRNALTSRCPGLRADNAITYETSLNQLCSVDIVYRLQTFGGAPQRGPACSLGQFVPVRLEKAPR
jgi:hypothetical protein